MLQNYWNGPYVPTETGCCTLAAETGEMHWLLDCPPNVRSSQNFPHYLAVTRLALILDKAIAQQEYVSAPQLYFEHDIVSDDADPDKRYKLYTIVGNNARGGNVIANADFANLVRVGEYARAYYWEYETGSDGSPKRVIQKKTPGFAGLALGAKFQQHFPEAQDMKVVAVCPNVGWREAMRKAALGLKDAKARDLWLFVCREDITVDSLLHAPIFFSAEGEARPFVKPPPPAAPLGEPRGGAEGGAVSDIISVDVART